MTEGMAKATINDVTSMAHTKSGMRLSDMPGARMRKIVTISSVAAIRADSSVIVTTADQISMPRSGEERDSVRGT